MKAKEILRKHLDASLYTLTKKGTGKLEFWIKWAMIEYAKAKVDERDDLLQDYADETGNEIAVQITIEKAKTPDFK